MLTCETRSANVIKKDLTPFSKALSINGTMWGEGFNRLPIQIYRKTTVEETIDYSYAGKYLIGRKRELTTAGVKPWMHRNYVKPSSCACT